MHMKNEKSPGIDGFPAEFYKIFWVKLKYITLHALNENSLKVVIDVVESLHGCDRELILNVVSQLRSMQIQSLPYGEYRVYGESEVKHVEC